MYKNHVEMASDKSENEIANCSMDSSDGLKLNPNKSKYKLKRKKSDSESSLNDVTLSPKLCRINTFDQKSATKACSYLQRKIEAMRNSCNSVEFRSSYHSDYSTDNETPKNNLSKYQTKKKHIDRKSYNSPESIFSYNSDHSTDNETPKKNTSKYEINKKSINEDCFKKPNGSQSYSQPSKFQRQISYSELSENLSKSPIADAVVPEPDEDYLESGQRNIAISNLVSEKENKLSMEHVRSRNPIYENAKNDRNNGTDVFEKNDKHYSEDEVFSIKRINKKNEDVKIRAKSESSGDDDYEPDSSADSVNSTTKLANMSFEIAPTWTVPDQHWIETRLTRFPTDMQRQSFQDLGVEMKLGPFSVQEDEQIKTNFADFCETYGFENNPELFLNKRFSSGDPNKITLANFDKKQRINFGRYLARGIPNRFIYSIYQRFQTMFSPVTSKGRYTQQEDNVLMGYIKYNTHKDKFAMAAELLGRSRVSVMQRYSRLCETRYDDTLSWNKDLVERFLILLLDHHGSNDINDLRGHSISPEIWRTIGEQLHMPSRKLRDFWTGRLSPQLFIKSEITLSQIRIKLVKLFYKAKIKSIRDIRWSEVAKHFDGLTPLFLWLKFDKLMKHRVPIEKRQNFEEALKFLKKKVVPQLKNDKSDRLLRRCRFSRETGIEFMDCDEINYGTGKRLSLEHYDV